ncbi:hypothetical protein Aph01nite_46260 [Acrocarpospora phusangensis]|uniref:Uncharacterized protein n=1 Tax=Acrocarpospora phusangensis TaxID=1070424 RepID=A0A919QE76_9ACTN|nr:hypothetical protein [Acrocarpospora phusangensis]GIH26316.1 hypothetical protein Aph01nite_46260 [Acrocarpospora phusangensis]
MPVHHGAAGFGPRARRRVPAVDDAEFGLVVTDPELRVGRPPVGPDRVKYGSTPRNSVYQATAAATSSAQKLIVLNPRRLVMSPAFARYFNRYAYDLAA